MIGRFAVILGRLATRTGKVAELLMKYAAKTKKLFAMKRQFSPWKKALAITDVRLDPRAMRFGSQDLAAEFLQAAERAQDNAAELSKEAVKALLGPASGAGDQRRFQDEH